MSYPPIELSYQRQALTLTLREPFHIAGYTFTELPTLQLHLHSGREQDMGLIDFPPPTKAVCTRPNSTRWPACST